MNYAQRKQHSRAVTLLFLIIIAIALLFVTGCESLTGTLTVPTEFGDAVIYHRDGATSIDLTLPRK